jgi:hypothetical protein
MLAESHPAWAEFVKEYFQCASCGDLASYINRCLSDPGDPQANAPDTSSSVWDLCAPVLIYIGVRFS